MSVESPSPSTGAEDDFLPPPPLPRVRNVDDGPSIVDGLPRLEAFIGDSSVTFFSNGLGSEQSQREFSSIISSFKRQRMLFGSVNNDPKLPSTSPSWEPTPALIALPYIWVRKNPKDRHHFGDVLRVNSIIAHALGYTSWSDYIKTRGWTCKFDRKENKYILRYRRLKDCLSNKTSEQTLHTMHLHEMLQKLYTRLSLIETQNKYGETQPLRYLKFSSFTAKVNSHAQDLQIASCIVENYFMQHVPDHKGDLEYWVEEVFKDCSTNQFTKLYSNDLLMLLPTSTDRDDGALQKNLLLRHRSCMRDHIFGLSSSVRFNARYNRLIEDEIGKRFQSRRSNDEAKTLAFVRARAKDRVIPILESQNPSMPLLQSLTRQRKKKKSSSHKRKRKGEHSFFPFFVLLRSYYATNEF